MSEFEFEPERVIKPIPHPLRNRLRSAYLLNSFPQLVSELLQNSLDAKATDVHIGIDYDDWSCWVRDNGSGIDRAGLDILANAGRYSMAIPFECHVANASNSFKALLNPRHTISRLYMAITHLVSGEKVHLLALVAKWNETLKCLPALSSIAEVSCVEIISRTPRSYQSWSIILKGDKCIYNGPATRWQSESAGTVVHVRDAFYNLPIRRTSHPSSSRTFELIQSNMERYALMFPEVSFSLEQIHSSRSVKPKTFKIPRTYSTLDAFRHLYGKGLVERSEEIKAIHEDGQTTIEGFVSLSGAHSKAYQLLYVNKHPVSISDLHRRINITLSSSSFYKRLLDSRESKTAYIRSKNTARNIELKAIYVLNITIPVNDVDNYLEPQKDLVYFKDPNKIADFLCDAIRDALIRCGFTFPSSSKSRTKAAIRSNEDIEVDKSPRKRRRVDPDGAQTLSQFSDLSISPRSSEDRELAAPGLDIRQEDGHIKWRDPKTGEVFIIDCITGNSYQYDVWERMQSGSNTCHETADEEKIAEYSSPRRITQRLDTTEETMISDSIPDWILQAMEENRAYNALQGRIPALPSTLQSHQSDFFCQNHGHEGRARRHIHNRHATLAQNDSAAGTRAERAFNKEHLTTARVLGQIDRKFIACLFENPCGGEGHYQRTTEQEMTLILIDQHAADERVRVEKYLKELCEGVRGQAQDNSNLLERVTLKPPIPIRLSQHDAATLAQSDEIVGDFRRWGVEFVGLPKEGLMEDGILGAYSEILVSTVPTVVSEKLLAGDDLATFVKGHLARLTEEGVPYHIQEPQEVSDDSSWGWTDTLRHCPPELVNLINSKACRGAIMFNDPLTINQCTKLVHNLAGTAFPFQCAHGRPSLVPLVTLPTCGRRVLPSIRWANLLAPSL